MDRLTSWQVVSSQGLKETIVALLVIMFVSICAGK